MPHGKTFVPVSVLPDRPACSSLVSWPHPPLLSIEDTRGLYCQHHHHQFTPSSPYPLSFTRTHPCSSWPAPTPVLTYPPITTMPARRRAPLLELPLVDYVPHPNGAIKAHCPSPLSLPTKRGPPTPSRASPSTPKRRFHSANPLERVTVSAASLATDELGTGKSPARRLFVNEYAHPLSKLTHRSTAAPETPRAAAPTTLAPSPPLSSRATGEVPALQRPRDPMHDPGFRVFFDPTGGAQPPSSELPPQVSHNDEENTPPCQGTPVSKSTRVLRSHNSPAIRAA